MRIPGKKEVSGKAVVRGEHSFRLSALASGIGESEDNIQYAADSRYLALSMYLVEAAAMDWDTESDDAVCQLHYLQLLATGLVGAVKEVVDSGEAPEWVYELDLP